MLIAALLDKVVTKTTSLSDGCDLLWRHPQIRHELLAVLGDQLEHVTVPLDDKAAVPLAVHARYTRIETLAAFGIGGGAKVAFYFLGPAHYVSHESELPMAITWRLRYALPGDLLAAFAAAVA